jgi:hypothetical protein
VRKVFKDFLSRPSTENNQIEERIASQPVRPVHGHAGALARGVKALKRPALPVEHLPVQVRGDSSHHVMTGGRHRDKIFGGVQPR